MDEKLESQYTKDFASTVGLKRVDIEYDPKWFSNARDSLPIDLHNEDLVEWSLVNRSLILDTLCTRHLMKIVNIKYMGAIENIRLFTEESNEQKQKMLEEANLLFKKDVDAIMHNPYSKGFLELVLPKRFNMKIPDTIYMEPLRGEVIWGCSVEIDTWLPFFN